MQQYINLRKAQLESMNAKITELALNIQNRISEIEKSNLGKKFVNSLIKIQDNLTNIAQQLNQQLKNFENPSENIVNIISKEINKIESSWQRLYSELEMKKS